MSSTAGTDTSVHQTSDQLVSVGAFHAIVWTGFSLCFIAFLCRAYIRILCHRRFLVDDYLVFLALLAVLGAAVDSQLYVVYVYIQIAVGNGHQAPGPNFLDELKIGLTAYAAEMILFYIGLLAIKLGFMVFFYRLGSNVTKFLILWWIILVLDLGCMAAIIGVTSWKCLLSDIITIQTVCHSSEILDQQEEMLKIAISLDVFSDFLIMCFPIAILWGTRISRQKKAILTATFCLVLVTIAITITRGPVFNSAYSSTDGNNKKVMNITWLWFWTTMELIVSFTVSCLVSFRSLFARKEYEASSIRARAIAASDGAKPLGIRARAKLLQKTLIDTLKTLDEDDNYELAILPNPESGTMSVDFARDGNWSEARRSLNGNADSLKTLQQVHSTI